MEEYLAHSAVKADQPTFIHPFDAVKTRLGQEFDADPHLFNEAKTLLRAKIESGKCSEITDADSYFSCLDKHFSNMEVLDYLINLTEHLMPFYIDLGNINVADLLKTLKQELENIQQRLEEDGLFEDRMFVGREQHITEIKKSLIEGNTIKGVCICGLGGLGKTSLAKKICVDLSQHWAIHKIDLREKYKLIDLLRITLDAFQQIYHHGDSEKDLVQQMITFFESKSITNKKHVLLFDNVDDIVAGEGEKVSLFLSNLLHALNRMGISCMIKVIITSRHKLTPRNLFETSFQKSKLKFDGLLQEIELEPLTQEEAFRLFALCTDEIVAIQLQKQIFSLCGFSPLAIRSIASVLKKGNITPKQIISNLKSREMDKDMPEISRVLQESFDVLRPGMQRELIQLSIFQAAPFDIFAAAEVLGADRIEKNKPIDINAKLSLLYLKSCHLVEIEKLRHSSSDLEETAVNPMRSSPGNIEYSLHPLVSKFLTEKSKMQQFARDMDVAKRRFVAYFKTVVKRFGELEEKNFWKAHGIMEKKKVHLLRFFNLLQSSSVDNVQSLKSSHEDILIAKRIADLVAFMFDDYERLTFIDKAFKLAGNRGDTLCSIFWLVQKGTLLYEMDRAALVSDVLNKIEQLIKCVKDNEEYEENAMASVLGHYYYLCGRHSIVNQDFEEAVHYLQSSEKFFRSIRSVKKHYISSLARVFNAMGNIYYKRQPIDLKKARTCYEKALQLVLSKTDNEFRNLDIPCYLTNIGTCFYREGVILSQHEEDPQTKYEEALSCYQIAIKCDEQMKMRESEDYAHKLSRRAEVFARLGQFDEAEFDIKTSMKLRRSLLAPPHESITITTHKVGDILKRKALAMYEKGEKAYKVMNVIYEARMYYQETQDLIKDGGLDKNHPEYPEIKKNHFWLEVQAEEPEEMRKIKSKYRKFEDGKYNKRAQARQSMDATIVDHMSREEKMKLLHSSDERWRLIQQIDLHDDSDTEEEYTTEEGEMDIDVEHLHLLEAIKQYAENLKNENQIQHEHEETKHSTSDDKDEDEVFDKEGKAASSRHFFLEDENSLASFLENYVPSFSNDDEEEDFWLLLSTSDETQPEEGAIGKVVMDDPTISRKRPSKEVLHSKKGKRE